MKEMQKEEFEKLIGHKVSLACYREIETVYLESERGFSKIGIANFYKERNMSGIDEELEIILRNREISNLKTQLETAKDRIAAFEKLIQNGVIKLGNLNINSKI